MIAAGTEWTSYNQMAVNRSYTSEYYSHHVKHVSFQGDGILTVVAVDVDVAFRE